jgi:iron complex transport system ATP-binding protein
MLETRRTIRPTETAQDLVFAYEKRTILDSVGIDLFPGEVLGILGPNGSGKSTFLKCLNRILEPRLGAVLVEDTNLRDLSRMEVSRSIGYVPQHSGESQADLTVFEVALMGRRPHHEWGSEKRDEEKTWQALDRLGLEELAARRLSQLSGGQRQKVFIARALVQEAKVLLLDEPTSSLHLRYQMDVMGLLSEVSRKDGVAVCAVIHDLNLALRFCDRAVLMKDGKVYASGDCAEVITADHILDVYHVEAELNSHRGRAHVVIL